MTSLRLNMKMVPDDDTSPINVQFPGGIPLYWQALHSAEPEHLDDTYYSVTRQGQIQDPGMNPERRGQPSAGRGVGHKYMTLRKMVHGKHPLDLPLQDYKLKS